MLKQKPYPIPNILDLLQSLNGLKYTTAIDLSMGYYQIPLCPKSQEYCTIENTQKTAKKGFKINLRKSFFAVDQFEYLGYWVTREGIFNHKKEKWMQS
jgi:hypothetical protein